MRRVCALLLFVACAVAPLPPVPVDFRKICDAPDGGQLHGWVRRGDMAFGCPR